MVKTESFAAKCEQSMQEICRGSPHVCPDMDGNGEMIASAFVIASILHPGRFHAKDELHRREARVDGGL
ncbi:hypothetical protein PWG15_29715 (plasmid) [Ensifer adhaerens]|uniref:hypothetical protein n=1 Tax=Ensifer adhaerens TaxID=106592 RepID=UPI0023A9BCC8|nr:hypothetical protein [Ensifer adhaerens]WDZ79616.1 hypothetical protein PWG15_29715 [Ensifer adhaerens]